MYDYQRLIFNAASHWSQATALVVFALGLLCMLQGFRFARLLLPLSCAGGGLIVGLILCQALGLPSVVIPAVAAGLGCLAFVRLKIAVVLSSAFTFAALGQYLAIQFGTHPNTSMIVAAVGLAAGFCMIWVCRRMLPIVVTILQGAGLLVVGFVGISCDLVPSLGLTFVEWAERLPLMVPALIVMLCVLGYSVQYNGFNGDISSGGRPGIHDLETS